VGSAWRWVSTGLSFFYPEVCQVCGETRATPAESFFCTTCRVKVRLINRPFCERCGLPYLGAVSHPFECGNCQGLDLQFRYARSAAVAKEGLLEVIHRYKYHRALWFEPYLGELLTAAASPELAAADWDWIVPVPLYPTREREREFNQAERLGRRLSLAVGIPLNPRLLRRVQPTRTQTLLSREERQENVRRAFALRGGRSVGGSRIVLVDDVFTTGATTNACARLLRKAGAVDVCVWTVARGA